MRFAALQLNCEFADVSRNLAKIESFVQQASASHADLLVLPEFFPSGIGFSPKMNPVALEGPRVREALKRLSAAHHIIIGGSYLFFDGTDSHNAFDLVFPDGSVFTHRKDIPTQFENCYYTTGDTDHVLHTPIGEIGVALCWEMIRYATLKRLSGKVDFVLAGSCSWDLPVDAPPEREPLRQSHRALTLQIPAEFAGRLHVPLVHANHCGTITAYNFPDGDRPVTRRLIGAAQIIGRQGKVIRQRRFDEGEGLVVADIAPDRSKREPAEIDAEKYWIPDLPEPYRNAWDKINPAAQRYYREQMLPLYRTLWEDQTHTR